MAPEQTHGPGGAVRLGEPPVGSRETAKATRARELLVEVGDASPRCRRSLRTTPSERGLPSFGMAQSSRSWPRHRPSRASRRAPCSRSRMALDHHARVLLGRGEHRDHRGLGSGAARGNRHEEAPRGRPRARYPGRARSRGSTRSDGCARGAARGRDARLDRAPHALRRLDRLDALGERREPVFPRAHDVGERAVGARACASKRWRARPRSVPSTYSAASACGGVGRELAHVSRPPSTVPWRPRQSLQAHEAAADVRLHRAQGLAHVLGELRVRQPVEEGERDRLALLGIELLQAVADRVRVLARPRARARARRTRPPGSARAPRPRPRSRARRGAATSRLRLRTIAVIHVVGALFACA